MDDTTATSPTTDDTTPGESALWGALKEIQNKLAHYDRQHDAGVEGLHSPKKFLYEAGLSIEQALAEAAPEAASVALSDLIAGYWDHIKSRKQCSPTGLQGLNDALGGGLEPGRLVVVLGAPGMGKTALTNQVADHVADAGRPVLYVTSEDTPFTLLAKTLSRIGDVNYTAVLKGWENERAKINNALARQADRLSSDRLRYIDASQGLTLDTMKVLAQKHFANHAQAGQGVLVVDYLQRIARAQRDLLGQGRELREVVTVLTEKLRAVAVKLDCCVIALASQNRASGYGNGISGANTLASAKESGDIEYTADVIMALTDDKERKPITASGVVLKPRTLRLDKNRQGDTATISLDWRGDRQMFTEAAQ